MILISHLCNTNSRSPLDQQLNVLWLKPTIDSDIPYFHTLRSQKSLPNSNEHMSHTDIESIALNMVRGIRNDMIEYMLNNSQSYRYDDTANSMNPANFAVCPRPIDC